MITTLLGGLTPRQFLEEYWQKKPLLVRGALPAFKGLLDPAELMAAACRDDVESRLVTRPQGQWDLAHGPFSPRHFRRHKAPWTLLVQGVNLFLPAGDQLMRAFDFIPYARLDDLMVSYAVDGGGVGPHFDNYDVFLVQGMGQRRWRIGAQKDQRLVEGLPIRILKDFRPSQEWVLEPGDLLYLPPQWAHDGIAVGECMTYSIGFRAPPVQELAEGFLGFLQDQLCLEGRYADPDLKPQHHPGEIGRHMVDQVETLLQQIRWDRKTVTNFLGCHLTEPKPHVFFEPPNRPLGRARFLARVGKKGLALDAKTQLLYAGSRFFMNGEILPPFPAEALRCLKCLADHRALAPTPLEGALGDWLYETYQDGFIVLK